MFNLKNIIDKRFGNIVTACNTSKVQLQIKTLELLNSIPKYFYTSFKHKNRLQMHIVYEKVINFQYMYFFD